jgi:hypothetical protein
VVDPNSAMTAQPKMAFSAVLAERATSLNKAWRMATNGS